MHRRNRIHRATHRPSAKHSPGEPRTTTIWPQVKAVLDRVWLPRETEEESRQAYLGFLQTVAKKESAQAEGVDMPVPREARRKRGPKEKRDDEW
jgi:hypothetical protein